MDAIRNHRVFVYGTLKSGYTNYERYLGVAVKNDKARLIGCGATSERYPMVVKTPDMDSGTCSPVLMDLPNTGLHVMGEVYAVDDSTLEALDLIEGVKTGYYYQKSVSIAVENGQDLFCLSYFFPRRDDLIALTSHPLYTDEHHARYHPRGVKPEIVALCVGGTNEAKSSFCGSSSTCDGYSDDEDSVASTKFSCGDSLSTDSDEEASAAALDSPDGVEHNVFVYGTLKTGYTNYHRYLGRAVTDRKARMVGIAATAESYPLVVKTSEMDSGTCSPVLIDLPSVGHNVVGEIFAVDDSTLEALDILEGIKNGYYYRKQLDVVLESGLSVSCLSYFFPRREDLLALTPCPKYTEEHHSKYRPGAVKPEILGLCLAHTSS